jgi:formylmethanofuran dehydrogenase subunit B
LCDDVTIEVRSGGQLEVSPSCELADQWFGQAGDHASHPASVDGQPVPYQTALQTAARLLGTSRAPIVLGLAGLGTAAQRAAVSLADQLGAVVDISHHGADSASSAGLEEVGKSTCTLGEVRHRADLIVFWQCDPMSSHPRLWQRVVEPAGEWVPRGRPGRKVVVVGASRGATASRADHVFEVAVEEQLPWLTALRSELAGRRWSDPPHHPLFRQQVTQLAELMRQARYGVVFCAAPQRSATSSPALHRATAQTMFQMVRERNEAGRFAVLSLEGPTTARAGANAAGARNVLAWQTGFGASVSFASGAPVSGREEFTADGLLATNAVDSILLLGRAGETLWSDAARRQLKGIPKIAIGPPPSSRNGADALVVDVEIFTGIDGIHSADTRYRLDDVPVRMRPVVPTELPRVAEVLAELESMTKG